MTIPRWHLALVGTLGLAAFSWSSPAAASCAPHAPLHMWPHELRDLENAVYKVLPPNTEIDADVTEVCSGRPRDSARLESRHLRTSGGEESWWQVSCTRGFGNWNCSSVRQAHMRVSLDRARVEMTLQILGDTPLTTALDLVRRAARVLVDPEATPMRCLTTAAYADNSKWPYVRERMLKAADLQPVVWAKENVAGVSFAHTAGLAVRFRIDTPEPLADCWYEDVEVITID